MPIVDCFAIPSSSGTTSVISDGKKKLLASIDMSQQQQGQIFSDGDYTFVTTPGSEVPSLIGKWKNLANNAGGSMQITGGRLVANTPTTITSMFGRTYWSALHAPVLAFDLKAFPAILSDTNFAKYSVSIEAEWDPMFTRSGSVYTSTVGTYCWSHAGIMQGGTAYLAGTQTYPTRFASAAYRSEATSGTASNYPYSTFHYTGSPPTGSAASNTMSQWSLNAPPWNSFTLDGATKWGQSWSVRQSRSFWATTSAKFIYFNGLQDSMGGTGSYWDLWDPTYNASAGGYHPTATNDLHAFVGFSRSTGSGTTNVRLKAINIYLQEIA